MKKIQKRIDLKDIDKEEIDIFLQSENFDEWFEKICKKKNLDPKKLISLWKHNFIILYRNGSLNKLTKARNK